MLILLVLHTNSWKIKKNNHDQLLEKCLLIQARPLLEEKVYMELVDPLIKDDMNLLQLVLIVRVVEKCLSYDPSERCSISEVRTFIN